MLALCAGYFGGGLDVAITAVTNIAMALPALPLTVLLIAYLSGGKWSLILAMSITADGNLADPAHPRSRSVR